MKTNLLAQVKGLASNKFVRNVAIVASGTAGAQAVVLLFAPLITRLYGPEAYGLQGTFLAALAVLTPASTLSFHFSIVLGETNQEARDLAQISVGVTVAVGLLLALALGLGGDTAAGLIGLEQLGSLIMLLPIALIFVGVQKVYLQWLLRQHQFSATAQGTLLNAMVRFTSEAVLGFWYAFGAVLVWTATISQGVYTILLWIVGQRSTPLKLFGGTELRTATLVSLLKKYRDFPLYRAPQQTLNALSHGIPVIVLGNFFGAAAAGFYVLARMAMMAPTTLITRSITDVLYPKLAEANHRGAELYPLVIKGTLLLAAIGALPFLSVLLWGPWIFSLVFGADWGMAGEYARWLSLSLFFLFISGPSVTVLPVIEALREHLILTALTIALRLGALVAGYYFFGTQTGTIAVFGIAGAVLNVCMTLTCLYLCSRYDTTGSKSSYESELR